MAGDTPEDDELERIALAQVYPDASQEQNEQGGPPRCPTCHRPVDDIEDMDEAALLAELRRGALRMLARNMREGQLTHQELAVLRGLLRDNNKALKPVAPEEDFEGEDNDPAMPQPSRTNLPQRRPRPDYDGTEG